MNENIDLYCIAFACPKGNRDTICPLFEIEHLSINEKIDWIDEKDKELQNTILKHHFLCTKKKLTKQG